MSLNKLTDDQRDLILAMIDDFNQFDDMDGVVQALMKVYNDGEYMGGTKLYLNSIREYWLKNIYGEDLSCWHDLRLLKHELRETIKL